MGQSAAGRALWLAQRRTGIGGSDAAAILGFDPYNDALGVWADKVGRSGELAQSEPMYWGSALEEPIARRYAQNHGVTLVSPGTIYRHPHAPIIIGTPDRLVVGQRRGLEVKTADKFMADRWGEPGTDAIPTHYLIQCLVYMAVMDFPVWDLAVLIGGNDYREYTVHRDPDLETTMLADLVRWWNEYVIDQKEPPATVKLSSAKALQELHPSDSGEMGEMSPLFLQQALNYLRLNEQIDALVKEQDALKHAMMQDIGDLSGRESETAKATWKKTKDRESVDWEGTARRLWSGLVADGKAEEGSEIPDGLIVRKTVPGVRRFMVGIRRASKEGK